MKILSTVAVIASGLAEFAKQVNIYKKEARKNNNKNLGGDDIKTQKLNN